MSAMLKQPATVGQAGTMAMTLVSAAVAAVSAPGGDPAIRKTELSCNWLRRNGSRLECVWRVRPVTSR